jgi:hypothetical protein
MEIFAWGAGGGTGLHGALLLYYYQQHVQLLFV